MREIKTSATTAEDRELFEIKLDDFILKASRPKDIVLGRAAGIFDDKYATTTLLARTAFEFLEACLEPESWVHLRERLNDRDDHFGTAELAEVFEALFDELTADDQKPTNRAASRAAKRTPDRG